MKKISKLLILILFMFLGLMAMSVESNAASTKFSANSSSVEVGDTITVTARVYAAQWSLEILANGNSIATNNELDNYESNITRTFTATYKATEPGTVTFELTGNMADFDQTTSNVTRTVRVTVTEPTPEEENPPEEQEPSGGNQGSGDSGNTSGNDNSDGSDSNNTTEQTEISFRNVNEKVYVQNTNNLNVRSSYSTSSGVIGTLKEGDSVTRTGVATKNVNGITWSRINYNGKTAYVSSQYLTTNEPDEDEEESNNKNLKSLSIEPYMLSPEFNPEVTEYTLTVGTDVDSIEVKAEPEDENAKVEITGNDNLLMGENTINIKVTAEDGTVRTYKIIVTKTEGTQLGLSELSVNGYTLSPEFSASVYDYKIDISDTSVTSLEVNAVANDENAEIEIVGNTDLKLGENIITILVKSEDGENIVTYQITVNIDETIAASAEVANDNNNNMYMYIGIGAGVVVVIIIIVVIIRRRKLNEEYYDEDENQNYDTFNSVGNLNSGNDMNKDIRSELNSEIDSKQGLNNDFVSPDEFKPIKKADTSNENNQNTDVENTKKDRKSVIEENFGADIKTDDLDENDKSNRKRGKHF